MRLKKTLTRRLIELQAEGYDLDFCLQEAKLICIQDSQVLSLSNAIIKVIDQIYDRLSGRFKYIHSVYTDSGKKGIVISEEIIINGVVA